MLRTLTLLLFLALSVNLGLAQSLDDRLADAEARREALEQQRDRVVAEIEDIHLAMVRRDLRAVGLPGNNVIEHSAMMLEYSESHEQARWVAHVISPEIISGTQYRSNDFRVDPKVPTGTAVEADYFLKELKPGTTDDYNYDGFGYDRGHLAPSADFRWSAKALSESYFYSNMSPQVADFNREGWAELESLLRGYVFEHPTTQLYVVTGGVLTDDLPVIERGINQVSIPRQFFKVVLDLEAGKAIGFLMPNERLAYPIEHYAVSVDAVETLTGLDFFNRIANQSAIEATLDKAHWLPAVKAGDVDPIYPPSLPRGHFNTVQAKQQMGNGRTVTVVGTVVSSRYSRSGNLWLNLDKKFPNQLFSVFIRKQDLVNFTGDPQATYEGQVIAVRGEVRDFNGTPTINLEREGEVRVFGE
ncbi:DNA/RNA non-specific endonuclease [Lewinella sp. W8]|uniref:DNA/RNA non-specific endonuclease n=1 Tax=Lewinella sp. W8 TaxID=2528208 RepID=UPI00106782F2|nr:DNA/RNA non-specific endonuclease [Lewinella sp. W8]MTB53699.1 DNA/RNA non-specific endonuclease [Lewinella sp. W8]